tara:strand:- start:255 stop:518 length:264 start_codon:yes stop_codon:yes gene_type:complete
MIKELKYLLFIFTICLFIFCTLKYYFSNDNQKNSYRLLKRVDKKIIIFSQDIPLLVSNTNGVVEYVEKTIDKNKKDYNFWKLISNDE